AFFLVTFFLVTFLFAVFFFAAFFLAFFFVAIQRSPGRAVRRAMEARYIGEASDIMEPTHQKMFHIPTIA
ncbi:MAG TPA: hypothetical protein DDZ83_06870, partial [Nitrospinae bacterium]|nr:hypothetical protein [Nitrospinota bacterium]